MTEQQIKQAAKEFAERKTDLNVPFSYGGLEYRRRALKFDSYDIEQAFADGASWRINSVWHKACDVAEPGKDCLVEHMDGDGNVCIRIDWRSEYEWIHACHYDKILRWAYVSDLLPEMKGGEK